VGLVKSATKHKVNTVLGVDASTNSFAFCLYGVDGPIRWGEIKFKGGSVFERLANGQKQVAATKALLKADLVVFESATFVQNKRTVILLAYAFGALISALMRPGVKIEEVAPMAWQNYLGNKALTKAEKQEIMDATPGRKPAWYSERFREFRKSRTIKWAFDTYGIDVESDNVADAIGVAHYGWHTLTVRP
jgi:hypothetical protein